MYFLVILKLRNPLEISILIVEKNKNALYHHNNGICLIATLLIKQESAKNHLICHPRVAEALAETQAATLGRQISDGTTQGRCMNKNPPSWHLRLFNF